MVFKLKQLTLLVWHYLNQPLFDSSARTAFDISRFLYLYRLQTLERCWHKDCAQQGQHHH